MKGKVVIVSGASSGIGRAVASKFTEAGAKVLAVGRNEAALGALRKDVAGQKGDLKIQLADLRENSQVEKIAPAAIEQFGKIDVLVNAAGIIGTGSVEDTDLEAWDKMIEINLRTVFYLTKLCVPHLVATAGNVVNVSSVAGSRAFPNVLAYCVSKAAVDQFTRCSALELAGKGVRVNAVNPGVVVTDLHKRGGMDEEKYSSFLEHSRTTHPLGRVGQPTEIADLILFLASEKASWITGETIAIDGGRAQTCAR